MNYIIIINIFILILILYYIKNNKLNENFNQSCKINSNCPQGMICCNNQQKKKTDDNENGICVLPCINSGINFCPKDEDRGICEKDQNENCFIDTDCIGWNQNKDIPAKCCKGKCVDFGDCPKSQLEESCANDNDCDYHEGNVMSCCKKDGNPLGNERKLGVCKISKVNAIPKNNCDINISFGKTNESLGTKLFSWCPKDPNIKIYGSEKELGEDCFCDSECKGWGNVYIGSKGVKCCKGKCTDTYGTNTCNKSNFGEKCKTNQDCKGNLKGKYIKIDASNLATHKKNHDGVDDVTMITCCKDDGAKNDINKKEWGKCSLPCVNQADKAICPKDPLAPSKCKRQLGGPCLTDNNCINGKCCGNNKKYKDGVMGVCIKLDQHCPKSEENEICRLDKDCVGYNSSIVKPDIVEDNLYTNKKIRIKHKIKNMKCCKGNGTNNEPNKQWGKCTKPCLENNGKGHCPKDPSAPSPCKKQIGEECIHGTDCQGGDTLGEIMCCQGRCKEVGSSMSCGLSDVGEKCIVATDCKGHGVSGWVKYTDKSGKSKKTKHIPCCKKQGSYKSDIPRNWGYCTPPCINAGVGWCPNLDNGNKDPARSCEKHLGEDCNTTADCIDWEAGVLPGTSCCEDPVDKSKKCTKKIKDFANAYYCPNHALKASKLAPCSDWKDSHGNYLQKDKIGDLSCWGFSHCSNKRGDELDAGLQYICGWDGSNCPKKKR